MIIQQEKSKTENQINVLEREKKQTILSDA
jgi:hypothetical protein